MFRLGSSTATNRSGYTARLRLINALTVPDLAEPIVPVTIKGAETVWPVGQMLPRLGEVTITYHPAIEVERLQEVASRLEMKECARRLARKTHDVVASALDPASLPEAEASDGLSLETNAL